MSLTRDEWCKMWETAKTIESIAKSLKSKAHQNRINQILFEVNKIKKDIQSVVGQME